MTLRYGMVFQKGGLHYLTSSSSFAGGMGAGFEGDYNSWNLKFRAAAPTGINEDPIFYIDEVNGRIWVFSSDNDKGQLAMYHIEDFSEILITTPKSRLAWYPPGFLQDQGFRTGVVEPYYGGLSKSAYSGYIAIPRGYPETEIEVWRGNSTTAAAWRRSLFDDGISYDNGDEIEQYGISLSGKYILVWTYDGDLLLYEGAAAIISLANHKLNSIRDSTCYGTSTYCKATAASGGNNWFDTVGKYSVFEWGENVEFNGFRHRGKIGQNGDGEFQLSYYSGGWNNITTFSTRDDTFSVRADVGTIVGTAIKLECTIVDSYSGGTPPYIGSCNTQLLCDYKP